MGIQGLLPLVRPVVQSAHISKFRGRRVAVDTYSWIHKAVYGSVEDLIANPDSVKWVSYCLAYIDMLLAFDIEVHLVFDGCNLPAKEHTEQQRASNRSKNLERGNQFSKVGNTSHARSHMARSVDVTPKMAAQLIRICKLHRPQVKCVVAPYEADAQLAYMCMAGIVDAVVSEDSDCIPYQCKEVLFKLDNRSGMCEHLVLRHLSDTKIENFDLRQFTPEMLATLCILSGCDYLPSLNGYGLKKSYKLVNRLRTPARVLRNLKFEGTIPLVPVKLPPSSLGTQHPSVLLYEFLFYQALLTFQHQTVFDVRMRKTSHLRPLPKNNDAGTFPEYITIPGRLIQSENKIEYSWIPAEGGVLEVLGSPLDDKTACGIADGYIDPETKEPFNLPELIDCSGLRLPETRRSISTSYSDSRNNSFTSNGAPHGNLNRRHTIGTAGSARVKNSATTNAKYSGSSKSILANTNSVKSYFSVRSSQSSTSVGGNSRPSSTSLAAKSSPHHGAISHAHHATDDSLKLNGGASSNTTMHTQWNEAMTNRQSKRPRDSISTKGALEKLQARKIQVASENIEQLSSPVSSKKSVGASSAVDNKIKTETYTETLSPPISPSRSLFDRFALDGPSRKVKASLITDLVDTAPFPQDENIPQSRVEVIIVEDSNSNSNHVWEKCVRNMAATSTADECNAVISSSKDLECHQPEVTKLSTKGRKKGKSSTPKTCKSSTLRQCTMFDKFRCVT
mmetsp:Transcript_15997/g.24120  ORF Transcript_15997/g.24120 Transcript_15997/m.24120 type:complete len:733 (+) Transcript_15997:3-2201(+)